MAAAILAHMAMQNAAHANAMNSITARLHMALRGSLGATTTDIDMMDAEMTDVGLTGVDVVDLTTDVIMMDAFIMDGTGQVEV